MSSSLPLTLHVEFSYFMLGFKNKLLRSRNMWGLAPNQRVKDSVKIYGKEPKLRHHAHRFEPSTCTKYSENDKFLCARSMLFKYI